MSNFSREISLIRAGKNEAALAIAEKQLALMVRADSELAVLKKQANECVVRLEELQYSISKKLHPESSELIAHRAEKNLIALEKTLVALLKQIGKTF